MGIEGILRRVDTILDIFLEERCHAGHFIVEVALTYTRDRLSRGGNEQSLTRRLDTKKDQKVLP